MRSVVLLVLLVLLVGGGVVMALFDFGGGGDAPPPGLGRGEKATPSTVGGAATIQPVPTGTVATRVDAPAIEAGEVAEEPTACLRIVDNESGAPLAGVVVRAVQNGADLAFSDEQGLAPVPLKERAQLTAVAPNYMLRLVPTRLGSTAEQPQEVRMVRDAWSFVRAFTFTAPNGQPVDDVFVRFRPTSDMRRDKSPVSPDDPVQQRIWQEHTMLAAREVARDVPVQLGTYDDGRVHCLASDAIVRFTTAGAYRLEAATTSGLVADVEVQVMPGPRPPAIDVRLLAGHYVRGLVRDLAGAPIADAEISVQGGEPLGLVARSDAQGAFALGPLRPGEVTLLARHGLHQPIALGPLQAPSEAVDVRLQALDRRSLRGRVRLQPALQPVAGATVVWQVPGGASISAKTAADGTFELQTAGDHDGTLRIQAPGCLPYVELVAPEAAYAEYDVLPADTRTRLAAGMTATLEGVVFAADGTPAPNVAVRWKPARATGQSVVPGRRVLEGAVLDLPLATTTGSDGAFVLETTQFGEGRLVMARNRDKFVDLTAVAGRTQNGIRFEQ